jgi:hypothetical protein
VYKLVDEPTTWIDMNWTDSDPDGFERENSIRMKVILLPMDEVLAIANGTSTEPTLDFVKRVGRDWAELLGPDGEPLAFNDDNIAMMIQRAPGFAAGVGESYVRGWGGKGKAREKNSEGSPADGQAGPAPEPTEPPRSQIS